MTQALTQALEKPELAFDKPRTFAIAVAFGRLLIKQGSDCRDTLRGVS